MSWTIRPKMMQMEGTKGKDRDGLKYVRWFTRNAWFGQGGCSESR